MTRTRARILAVRLTEKELQTVKKLVKRSGLRQQDYLVAAITQKEIVAIDGLHTLMVSLPRIGNNLNQIARRCNEGEPATLEEVTRARKELGDVWAMVRQVFDQTRYVGALDLPDAAEPRRQDKG